MYHGIRLRRFALVNLTLGFSMDNPLWLKLVLIWLVWVGFALIGGGIAAIVIDEHGSIVIVVFAVPVGLLGAIATSMALVSSFLKRLKRWVRVVTVTLVALAPIASMSIYGLLAKSTYSVASAIEFFWPFALAALLVACLTELTILRPRAVIAT